MTFPLWEVLSGKELSDNTVAASLYKQWENIASHQLKNEDLVHYIKNEFSHLDDIKSKEESLGFETFANVDLRIVMLSLSGFRGFPPVEPGNPAYGLDMRIKTGEKEFKGDPASLVVLGGNGSGKSSLYNAMEYLCLGRTAIEDKVNENDIRFFHHYFKRSNTLAARIYMNGGESAIILHNDTANENTGLFHKVDLKPFFCSESNLALMECGVKDETSYLYELIGLNDIVEAIKVVEALSSHFGEEVKKSIQDGKEDDANDASALGAYCNALSRKLKDQRKNLALQVLSDAQEIIETLVGPFLNDDLELDYDPFGKYDDNPGSVDANSEGKESVKIFNGKLKRRKSADVDVQDEVIVTGNEKPLSPKKIFNNFRYKLYLVSLRIAIAFYVMKRRKIRFPLVFDDIFDSSDFGNRLATKKYFKSIVWLYHKLKVNEQAPLQIIFFTQDEVIAESVYEALVAEEYGEEDDSIFRGDMVMSPVILGRLFDYQEVKNSDMKTFLKYDEKEKKECIEDKFYNLYDLINIKL